MKLILTGHYAGRTVKLNGHTFVNGELPLAGDLKSMDGLVAYFRTYNAFLSGSNELAAAQARDAKEKGNGTDKVLDGQAGANAGGLPANGPATGTTSGQGATGASPAPEGSVAGGDGSQEGHLPDAGKVTDPSLLKVLDAVKALDPMSDEHWTAAGLPQVAAVATAAGIPTVTRKDIETVMPGYNRDAAKAAI